MSNSARAAPRSPARGLSLVLMIALAVTGLTACGSPEQNGPDSGVSVPPNDSGQPGEPDGGVIGGDAGADAPDAGDAGTVTPDAGAGSPDAGDAGAIDPDGGSPDAGGCKPAASELCNGLDDDCDGEVDEGFVLGTPCDGPDTDRCMEGQVVCAADGGTACGDDTGDSVERCNLSDDDCDGEVDEGFHVGEACDGKDSDLCAEGELICNASGGAVCSDVTSSTVERCNGADDDCDGQVDEDFDLQTDMAHCGRCGNACNATTQQCVSGACLPLTELACDNGLDDDADGARDCADTDCDQQSCGTGCTCQGGIPAETLCGDTLDNDGDGKTDCADPDCDGPACATLRSITLTPGDVQLVVQGSTGAVQKFTVTGTWSDGRTEDVTSRAVFSIEDTRLGSFTGATFTSSTSLAGTSTVRARVDTLSVSTSLTVKLDLRIADARSTSLPPQPETRFDGAVDASRKPQIVYPNDGTLVPPNLEQMEIHFLPGPTTNTLFELSFSTDITDVRVYLRCYLPSGFALPSGVSRGCIYTPSQEVWRFVAESNRGGQPVRLGLRATDDSGAGTVGVSNPLTLNVSGSSLEGALYYFTLAGSTGIMRYDFSSPSPRSPTVVMKASNVSTSVSCVGCHAVSRNGKKMVVEVNGQNDGRIALADLSSFTSTTQVPLAQGGTKLSMFQSWNPDGTRFAGVYGDSGATRFNLMLFDGNTGALLGEIADTGTSTNPASHPDWSADGKTLAFTSVGIKGTLQRFFKGSIKVVTEQSGGLWSSPVTVVPSQSGKNRYAPAIAPDSSFLVYDESTCPTSSETHMYCNSDSDPSARLWAARLQVSSAPVELARANAPGVMDSSVDLTNSYPRWNPFVARGVAGSSRVMWVTFASSRMYGLRTPPTSPFSAENSRGSFLWVAAVDPDKLASGLDPSFPAFALPFQDPTAAHHLPQWTGYAVSNACSTAGEACGGTGGTCCNGLQCVQAGIDPPRACDASGACVCNAMPN